MIKCSKCNYICEDVYICPNCHVILNENIRIAQFGGVGGNTPQSWAPGSSPNAKNMTGGSFSWVIDQGLDAIMQNTRHNVDEDETPEANYESRLEKMHSYLEEDSIPFLSFKERQELKNKKNEQRRRKFQEDSDKSIVENSPAFINANFAAKLEHVSPMEALLDKVRTNEEKNESIYNDKVMILDSNGKERVASNRFSAPKVRHNLTTVFGPHEEYEDGQPTLTDSGDAGYPTLDADDAQFSYFPMGNSGEMTSMFSSKDADKYLDGDGVDNLNGFLDESTEAFNYPGSDEVQMMGERGNDPLPSPLSSTDVNNTTERKLSKLNNPISTERLPTDPYARQNMDEIRGQEGLQTKYPSKDLALGYPAPMPHM